jgi:RNA polymerase sigma-70 factor (ECF subfamily)
MGLRARFPLPVEVPPNVEVPPTVVDGCDSRPPGLDDLFQRYAPYVATIGFRLLGDDHELDDLVQDVFVEAHRGLHQLRDAGAAKGWLARIAVRGATRRLRRRRLRAFFSLDAVSDHEALVDAAATPEERAHITSTYRLLARLPVAQRVTWILRHIEGETLDGIAELCRCSKATVQRRIRAAQKTLEEAAQKALEERVA